MAGGEPSGGVRRHGDAPRDDGRGCRLGCGGGRSRRGGRVGAAGCTHDVVVSARATVCEPTRPASPRAGRGHPSLPLVALAEGGSGTRSVRVGSSVALKGPSGEVGKMTTRCAGCGAHLWWTRCTQAWVDNSGGDVCGCEGGNEAHRAVLDAGQCGQSCARVKEVRGGRLAWSPMGGVGHEHSLA